MPSPISSFTPDLQFEDAVRAKAELAVSTAAAEYGLNLDYTEGSIRLLEQILDRLSQSESGAAVSREGKAAEAYGSYFGEVVRRNHGGTWGVGEILGHKTAALRMPGKGDHTVYPWNITRSRILHGKMNDIRDAYQALVHPPAPRRDTAAPPDQAVLQELYRKANDPDRLYPVRSNKWYGFYAGRLQDGRQALVTGGRDGLAVHLFNGEGSFLGVEHRKPTLSRPPEESYLLVNDDELHAYLRAEFGFEPALIRVKRFDHPDAQLEVEPLPVHYQEYMEDGEQEWFDDDDRQSYPRIIYDWLANREFVVHYGNDYWLDDNGDVTSS